MLNSSPLDKVADSLVTLPWGIIGIITLSAFALVFVSMSAIYVYHWFAYGTNRRNSLLISSVYVGGGVLLLVVAFIGLSMALHGI